MKKSISEEKVQRMRNIVKGDYTKSVKTQVGYKKVEERSEGDIWEDGNKIWTIKNGIKQTISKMQKVRDFIKMPLCCPECGGIMKGQFDKHHWNINRKCLSCVTLEEQQMRNNGTYEEKRKELFKKSKYAQLDDLTEEFNSWLEDNSTFVTELGEIEDWSGGLNKAEMKAKFKKELLDYKKQLSDM